MTRLPQPGGDPDNWGVILNDFLSQLHESDGTLKNGVITEAKLDSGVQAKLNAGSPAGVSAVNGRTGSITLTASDVGLSSVDNTSDASKPVSTATQAALSGKAATTHSHTASQISDASVTGLAVLTAVSAASARSILGAGTSDLTLGTIAGTAKAGDYVPTKADVGLGSVDNTSDASKNSASVTLTNKSISGASNTISNIAESAVTGLTTDLATKAPLADTPRYLLYNAGWPDRPADSRMTFFLGGNATSNAPSDSDLKTGDIWIPSS